MLDLFKNTLDLIYGQIFPPFCLNCYREGHYICGDCQLFLIESELVCPGCGYPSTSGLTHKKCDSLLSGQLIIWENRGLSKQVIERLVQNNVYHATDELSQKIIATVLSHCDLNNFWSIWFDGGTKIIPVWSNDKNSEKNIVCSIAKHMILLTNRNQKSCFVSKSPRAVIISLTQNKSVLLKAEELKNQGVKEIWLLALTSSLC